MARRGGSEDGASRAITIAASRVVRALADSGCRARILTAPRSNPPRCRSVAASIRRPSQRRGSTHRCPECATPATESTRAT
ncbi:type VII secretion protein EccE [Rhodococcus koreensis]|uniref:type VII secretion protein EccE n=1 Tax=Rhodococcus koreensis TaxID=99653 RepID=UPI0036D9B907